MNKPRTTQELIDSGQLTSEGELLTKSRVVLNDPELFDKLVKEISKKVVKEEDTISCVLLCCCGRLVKNCKLTSYNLFVNAESNAGKDWVVSKVLEIMPKSQYVKKTRITEKVFTYWHNAKFEPEWTWDGKVFYNEDISNRVLNSDVFKVFSSSGSSTTVIIKQRAFEIDINGKPVMLLTSANSVPSKEIRGRYPIINIDESIDQTKEIMKRSGELAKIGKTIEYDTFLIDAQAHLERVEVIIPYADKLYLIFPYESIMMRRHFDRFLDYIKASTALHQFQRERDEEGRLIATPKDYNIARIALLKSTSNPLMVPLTKKEQMVLDIFKKLKGGEEMQSGWCLSELEKYINFFSDRQLRTVLNKLVGYGFLNREQETRAWSKKDVAVYIYRELLDIDIPLWGDELEKRIEKLDKLEKKLEEEKRIIEEQKKQKKQK